MNPDLQSKLVEIITSIQTGITTAGTFVLDQLPDIAQQYVAYGRGLYLIYFLCLLGFFVTSIVLCVKLYKTSIGKYDPFNHYVGIGFIVAGNVISMSIWVHVLTTGLLVWVAPKVWLLKELASLIK